MVDSVDAPLTAKLVGHRRRHVGVAIVAPACVVVIVIALAAALHARGGRLGGAPATSGVPSTSHTAAVTTLQNYRWRTLPKAPIAARTGAAGVWTGTELLVWGGSDAHDNYFADGAAYNPTTHTWTMLPRSPLSARSQPSSVWTGSRLFISGGLNSSIGRLRDAATYDPASRRWTKLPRDPAVSQGSAQAYAVGGKVVLLTTTAGQSHGTIDATSFNPASNTWSRLPSVQLAKNHDGESVVAVAAGDRLFVWSLWAHSIHHTDGSGSIHAGVDGYTLDPGRRTWAHNRLTPDEGLYSDQPLWTGNRVLLPAEDVWCGLCPGPMIMGRTGLSLDPRTGARTRIPHGPVDDLNPAYLWTGAELLAVDTTTERSGGARHDRPGEAAVWNPTTQTWTRLPNAPLYGDDQSTTVWTGSEVLIWGMLSTRSGRSDPHTGIELSAS